MLGLYLISVDVVESGGSNGGVRLTKYWSLRSLHVTRDTSYSTVVQYNADKTAVLVVDSLGLQIPYANGSFLEQSLNARCWPCHEKRCSHGLGLLRSHFESTRHFTCSSRRFMMRRVFFSDKCRTCSSLLKYDWSYHYGSGSSSFSWPQTRLGVGPQLCGYALA